MELRCWHESLKTEGWDQRVMEINGHLFALNRFRDIIPNRGRGIYVSVIDPLTPAERVARKKVKVHRKRYLVGVVTAALRSRHPQLRPLPRFTPIPKCSEGDCVNPEHYTCKELLKEDGL